MDVVSKLINNGLFLLQEIESIIAVATVLNFNNTLKSVNLNRPILFTRQVSKFTWL